MKTKNIILMGVVVIVLISIIYSFQGNQTDEGYIAKIEKSRKEKDHTMRNTSDSPFAGRVEEYKGLTYFPVDGKYRINARLERIENKKTITLPTSDGKEKTYLEYGYAEFELDGIKNRLLILEMIQAGPYKGTLFLPFADETSANETYGAGRYLEFKKGPAGATSITIDFNEAYNPYCAYSDKYSCPFPPAENLLKVAIRAGEMNYNK
jgi:uncharacterized protein (DUF1684 family)